MKTSLILFGLVLNLVWTPLLCAEDNTCWLTAPQQDDVWVIVYDADDDGNRGAVIWEGKIPAGGKVKIKSTDGHIRYDYKPAPDQPYQGDNSAGCFQQKSFTVE